MQVPDGWLEVIRGPQPKSEQWPRRQSVTHQTDRPGRREERQHPPQGPFQDAPRSLSGAVGCPRQGSRYQVGGGNASSWRIGPDIPCITRRSEPRTCPSGGVALPVEDCIATETFLQRARKRAKNDRQEVKKARAASSSAKAKLHQENASIAQAEDRLRTLQEEAAGVRASVPPPTMRFCSGIGSIASRNARVDARTHLCSHAAAR